MKGRTEEGALEACRELQEHVRILRDALERGDFGQGYQEALQKLDEKASEQAETFFFFAAFAASRGEWRDALALAENACRRRRISRAIWRLLYMCHMALGERKAALKYRFLLMRTGEEKMTELTREELSGERDMLRSVFALPYLPPFVGEPEERDGDIAFVRVPLLGEELPYAFEEGEQEFSYHAGLLNEEGCFGLFANLVFCLMAQKKGKRNIVGWFNDFWFDILRTAEKKKAVFLHADLPCIVPLMGKSESQTIRLQEGERQIGIVLAPRETSFVRLEKPCRLTSKEPFLMGRPVKLGHSPKRRKLVLNILADGLSWPAQRLDGYENIPNIMRFFSEGVIFENCWSAAEYTYPSLASIETGLHLHKSQIFERSVFMRLEQEKRTISEKMRELGYYTVNLMGGGEGVVNGATRGFERLLVNLGIKQQASVGVVRTMTHLDAFREVDNFVLLHLADPHPCASDIALPANMRAKFPPEAFRPVEDVASVFLQSAPVMRETNRWKVRVFDRELGILFDYLEENYAPEEYVVHLYSDHGVSVYDDDWLLADTHVGASLMMRGAGVPQLGQVEELASSLDLYKIMAKTCGFSADEPWLDSNLPEVFGGKKREYVISNSIYPGQTYKLAIRTEEHEFRLETEAPTAPDGTVDMAQFSYQIRTRGKEPRIIASPELSRYFLEIARRHTQPFWNLHMANFQDRPSRNADAER